MYDGCKFYDSGLFFKDDKAIRKVTQPWFRWMPVRWLWALHRQSYHERVPFTEEFAAAAFIVLCLIALVGFATAFFVIGRWSV